MKTTARKKVSLAFLLACWCLVFAQLGIVKSQDLFEEFNEGQFDSSKWDFIDPLQDCSYAVNDGYLEINVPAGQSHNMWNPNNAPRLVRTLPDVDFGLEVKFDSEPVEKYQSQGLIVQQDQNNYIRYDIYSDGSNLRLFAAVHDNGSWSTKLNKIVPKGGPYYLLVGRQGDSWSFYLSYNGQDYTEHLSLSHSMAVTSGGVFGFNHGTGSNNAPAFKARADYFYFTQTTSDDGFIDEFNTFNTNVWAFVNPLGDSSAGTANGRLYIDVAGGASHHPWTINEAPRVMKSIPNGDFYIEAQFVSTPSKGYQMQGLQAEQGPGNYIRYELYHDGTNLRVYAAKFVNGSAHTMLNKPISLSPPYVLSIYRQGNSWEMGLSSENTTQETVVSFNQSYTINSVGMHAGNYDTGNNAPAFTALMEYFYQDTFGEPPAEKYNLNVSVSGEGTVSRSPNKSEYDKGEQVTLTASAAQGWKFSSWSGDASGSQNPLTITVDKNLNVTAVFEPIEQEGQFFDEFNTFNTNVWAFVNPLGDSSVSVDNGKLHINVAGGANHDAWIENDAPRIMKSVANTDFRIETRFDSEPNEQYQMQGLIAEQSNSNYVRYELHNDGNGLRIYAAHFVNGVVSVQLSQRTNYKPPYYMSIVREGSTWNLRLSGDGISWNTVKTFDHSYNIQQVGLYGGNYRADGNPPAFQAIADHFLYEQLEGSPGQYTLDISKRGEGQVSVSPAGPYDFGDMVQLSATPASGWIFIGWAGDIMTTSNPSTITITKSHNVTAIFEKASEPTFNIWYGREQDFVIGNPQRWINVLGNVTNPGQISNLTFSLNEGAENRLSMGPDENIRLALPGDFNAEISISSLSQGVNYVRFTATNTSGQQARYTVVVNYAGRNKRWPIPYTIKWSEVDNIQDVAQVTDGRWVVDSNGLHTTNAWYDRLVAIGDIEWSDYEITGSFIVHQHYYTVGQPGNQPLVGFLLRWTGHFNWYGEQPNEGWWPFGAIGGFRWLDHTTRGYWRIVGNQNKVIAQESTQSNLELGKRYMMKMQVQSVKNQGSYYRFKRWTAGQPEPQQWQLVAQEKITDPQKGSILLLAHHVDVTFGDVTVVPLNPIQ